MVVLDTHAWLWLNDDPSRLSEQARAEIETAGATGVSAISCWEVALLEAKGRIRLRGGPGLWVRSALRKPGVVAIPVSPKIALEAAQLDLGEFPGDPADRMIYATARNAGAPLVTRDRRILEFDPRGTRW